MRTVEVVPREGYAEQRVEYSGRSGELVPAFRLVPDGSGPFPAVVVHNQHNGERHLGKSEVVGLAGDPLQAFGPPLARAGILVLASDSVCFEDRRGGPPGIEPRKDDWHQHYNAMAYALLERRLLTTRVLEDSVAAVSAVASSREVIADRIGCVGHSYGANTTLFHAALDERVAFAAASGAACTFATKIAEGTGIELAEVIPGLLEIADLDDVVGLIAPRALLLCSATDDPYSRDAPGIVHSAAQVYDELDAGDALTHHRADGGHALDEERARAFVEWIAGAALRTA